MRILSHLEPQTVFHYFEEICSIPHGSTNTKCISDYCIRFARERNLACRQDSSHNVIIFKPGAAGYEDSAPVMIQGHLDMVCEKEAGCTLHMDTQGLDLQLQGGKISARGTTLGGDDGIAVAYALALLDATDIPHPPLEVVLTADEEIGMLGAAALDCSPLSSRTMLNLDSEEEGYLLASCAGGVTALGRLPLSRFQADGVKATLEITGLLGGHSGVEIDKGRANACKLLGRTLYTLQRSCPFLLCSAQGGQKDNAIPREACATFLIKEGTDTQPLLDLTAQIQETYRNEYRQTDPSIQCTLTLSGEASLPAMTPEAGGRVISALAALPNGIQRMSRDVEGLVQTSLNLGILETCEEEVTYSFAVRSSLESEKTALVDQLRCLTESLGGSLETSGDYPAWEYRQDSPLRDLMVEVFAEQYGRKPVIQAIHAGVECGLFAGKIPELDCISFGPDMQDIHTTQESLDVESVRRTWLYLLEVLRRMK